MWIRPIVQRIADLRDLVIVGQKRLQRLDLPIGRINFRNLPRTQWGMVVLDLP